MVRRHTKGHTPLTKLPRRTRRERRDPRGLSWSEAVARMSDEERRARGLPPR